MASDVLAKVAAAIGKLPRDKENKFSGYSYTSEEAVKTAVNRELSAVGMVPSTVEIEVLSDVMVDGKQGKQNLVKARCTIVVEGCRWQGVGAGIDYADKALMKAQTAAVREAWKNGFTIPSGDDPEVATEDERSPSRLNPSPRDPYVPGKSNPNTEHTPPPSTSGRAKYPDPNDRLRFGMHKGKLWSELPDNYLDVILDKFDNETLKNLARGEQMRRGEGHPAP